MTHATSALSPDEVLALIARHDDAWNAQDLDAAMACYTAGIVFTNHNAGETATGAEAVRARSPRSIAATCARRIRS